MIIRMMLSLSLFAFLTLITVANTSAQSIDPHRLYEERCARCHVPHAGDLVHNDLFQSGGKIIGRETSKELRALLDAGHGRLNGQEINVMVDHLVSILESGRIFHKKCKICHDQAVVLARSELIIRNGRLTGRYTGRDMEAFLTYHGRLEEDEVGKMLKVLRRQLMEQ